MAKRDPLDKMAAMRKRYAVADECSSKYAECIADIRFTFVPGSQWDAEMKSKRGIRPMYEFNKTRPVVKSVTNDMRQNSPSIKIRAAEDGHKDLADIMQGLIRNIEAQSRADTAYDTAGFYAAAGGYGVFRIATEYSNDDVFEQDIRIKEVRNPFSIKFGPAKEFDKRDARYLFVEDSMTLDAFEDKYPSSERVDFSTGSGGNRYGDWYSEKRVRIAEYWYKKPVTKTIYQLSDGRVLDADDYLAMMPMLGMPGPNGEPPLSLKNERVVKSDKIMVEIVSGAEVLESFEWAGKFFPFVPVWGEAVNVDGEEIYAGIARPIKDAQRLFNWDVCVGQEVMANAPRAPYLFTAKMIEGYEREWANIATSNAPGLPYNVDSDAPGGRPSREQPPMFPAGFFQSAQFASDLIKSVSNVVDAPVARRASSGIALQSVENQQDTGNFDYIDNLARAKAFGGEILIDLITKIYDTERQVMILGADGAESYRTLNETVQAPDGSWQVINDLSQGKYAVVVTIGQSFATRRMETVAAMTQVAGNPNPQIAALGSYGLIKNMDEPGMEDVEKGIRKMLVGQGLLEPGEGDAPPPQAPVDPRAEAEAKLKAAQAGKAEADTGKTKVETAILVQHAPMAAMQEAAKTEQSTVDAFTKDPTTDYFGPPPPFGR